MQTFNNRTKIISTINRYCREATPFIFMIDYLGDNGVVYTIEELKQSEVYCSINGKELNKSYKAIATTAKHNLTIKPIPYNIYKKSFNRAVAEIKGGNSYLLNLTFATSIGHDIDLKAIYNSSKAKYKLYYKGEFAFYSPEPFIKIKGDKISSFPMKGTIKSSLPDAENKLLESKKERCEHFTIVDLIRNDLSKVATNVKVERLRYIEKIKTQNDEILQTSSQISGILPKNWRDNFGTTLFKMLPAGSITGAPKDKTVDIISEIETTKRGYYTGVMGYFDGEDIDSSVIIRYIEKGEHNEYYYRSGGGITSQSDIDDEYNEMINKIYVPTI